MCEINIFDILREGSGGLGGANFVLCLCINVA